MIMVVIIVVIVIVIIPAVTTLRYIMSAGVETKCASNNGNCSSLAVCTDTAGDVTCTCPDGYTGDGYNCSGKSTRR